MKKVWTDGAWEDYLHWQKNDRALLRKINDLIRDAERNPFSGLGKPEPLKEGLAGWWSRRITGEHRLVYRVTGSGDAQALEILACRYHY
ncbi:Txe/YoeB family addiction module toxin [Azospirillum palustre]|uniref:Putative mRNA interferase YoeB n=1 Tax=Azospirillum palustre TaxID=2044885 RepID=A0A2B8BDC3_9PROT|nr:Txe/YoeB family addiction module toxin [Azospirillum palustre]PGH55247.1 Txe/YoeB family addiction module toxin [Azospirillum palustre]